MTSLPKRGDRVRVTEVIARVPLSPEVGDEVTLSCDAREEPSGIVFMFWGNGRDGGGQWHSGYVKVEILDRASWLVEGLRDVAAEAAANPGIRELVATNPSGFIQTPALEAAQDGLRKLEELTGASAHYVHPEFARGMRRAVEIAEGLPWQLSKGDYLVEKLKEAVEKEIADG